MLICGLYSEKKECDMGEHQYTAVGNPADMSWVDPTGQYANQQQNLQNFLTQQNANLGNAANPQGAYNAFMGQQAGLANIAQGATAPLTQQLNAVAQREAALGGEAALASMPGASQSGAGMAAFGQAYADPFARAAAQTQQAQLGLTGNLWNQALGGNYAQQQNLASIYGNLAGSALGQQTQMAGQQGAMFMPQYQQEKNFWDYAVPLAAPIAQAGSSLLMGPGGA